MKKYRWSFWCAHRTDITFFTNVEVKIELQKSCGAEWMSHWPTTTDEKFCVTILNTEALFPLGHESRTPGQVW